MRNLTQEDEKFLVEKIVQQIHYFGRKYPIFRKFISGDLTFSCGKLS